MENNKELELLREFYNNVINNGDYENYYDLKQRIEEIQKQNKLKRKIEILKTSINEGPRPSHSLELFNEILKELNYKC